MESVVAAVIDNKSTIAALGGHVVKTGCSPYLIDWIKQGVLTGLCLNGAAAVHDVELAISGRTSEDVADRLPDGAFGMTRETAECFATATTSAVDNGTGLGAALGRHLLDSPCRCPELSLLRVAAEANIPCTVHVAIGTDIVHMLPCADGAKIGAATMSDFRLACRMVAGLAGGVWMNLGSAVVLPEVFLKAMSIAHNLGHDLSGMTAIDLDMIKHYRTRMNVIERHQCRGISITGHHEIMIPLVHAAVTDRLAVVRQAL